MRNLFFCLFAATLLLCCKRERFTTSPDAVLQTDVDTLHFDTVFTSAGSSSQVFKILNSNTKAIKIGSVRLAGGVNSPFKMNVDGIAGVQTQNIEIASGDSAYVFITVSINPNTSNLPFIVRDSVEIAYNGRTKWVQLDAYGQNAHFLKNQTITANSTWNNDLPYVILGSLTVNPNAILTIKEGCRIFMHADAPFIVHGSLQVNGNKYDSTRVVFSGDRLDDPYRDFPAGFPGIIFTGTSKDNRISYGIIKNAYQGIVALDPSATTKLSLNETIIDNAYDAGILGVNTSIMARNVLVSNCGKNILLVKGGTYNFTHCTVASFSTNFIPHKEPVLAVSNFISQNNVVSTADLSATFRNCIFWGESGGLVKSEVTTARQGSTSFNVIFDNVLWRVPANPDHVTVTGTDSKNQDPQFEDTKPGSLYNFRLKEGSPARDKGINTGISIDLDGKSRPVGLPDLGAYEKQ